MITEYRSSEDFGEYIMLLLLEISSGEAVEQINPKQDHTPSSISEPKYADGQNNKRRSPSRLAKDRQCSM
jgi:hypothetical protein